VDFVRPYSVRKLENETIKLPGVHAVETRAVDN
jgi:hypothetical protein